MVNLDSGDNRDWPKQTWDLVHVTDRASAEAEARSHGVTLRQWLRATPAVRVAIRGGRAPGWLRRVVAEELGEDTFGP